MSEKELKDLLKGYDRTAVLRKDSKRSFRIFLYRNLRRMQIMTAIQKKDDWRVEGISEYTPILPDQPVTVIRLTRLRIAPNTKRMRRRTPYAKGSADIEGSE